ncbi:DUF5337 domain-containing protein [Palleronia caenipelagi]|nr:DUF5337 domain-containing protein [Palleronia caenipelagi]
MSDDDLKIARQARNIGVVMAMTMIIWMAIQLIGASLGLPGQLVYVADAAALIAFVWALVATFRIWQKRRNQR